MTGKNGVRKNGVRRAKLRFSARARLLSVLKDPSNAQSAAETRLDMFISGERRWEAWGMLGMVVRRW